MQHFLYFILFIIQHILLSIQIIIVPEVVVAFVVGVVEVSMVVVPAVVAEVVDGSVDVSPIVEIVDVGGCVVVVAALVKKIDFIKLFF